jgi:hypothetical protein
MVRSSTHFVIRWGLGAEMDSVMEKIGRLLRDPSVQIDSFGFAVAMTVSLLVAAIVSLLYQLFYENRATGAQIHRSFFLISPSVTALFIAIQHSLPLSLGLLGALSIIRFRTPIKEPEEIGFLMLLIASSVVCATFQFCLLAALLGSVFVALLLTQKLRPLFFGGRREGTLLLSLRGDVEDETRDNVLALLRERLDGAKLRSLTFAGNVTTFHYSFSGTKSTGLEALRKALEAVSPVEKLNIFFSDRGVC